MCLLVIFWRLLSALVVSTLSEKVFSIMGFALGLTTVAMLFFKVVHPPAGSNPIAIFLTGPDWSFLFTPTPAGALVIVTLGIAYNNLWRDRSYSKYW